MEVDPFDDHYALLGVTPSAGRSELRRAYRKLALRWHPDRAGRAATAIFQRIAAAYEVLSNPGARAAYDLRRGTSAPPATAARRAPGVMLRRLTGPLNALLACGVARYAGEDLELVLSPSEAAEGGMATISMRVPVQRGAQLSEELFSAWLAVPPEVADGAVLVPSAQLPGVLRPVTFRVRLG